MPPRPIESPSWYRSPKTSIGILLIGTQVDALFLHVGARWCALISFFCIHYCNVFCNIMEHLPTLCFKDIIRLECREDFARCILHCGESLTQQDDGSPYTLLILFRCIDSPRGRKHD